MISAHLQHGSPLSFTPDHSGTYKVVFDSGKEKWSEPLIGWAVVLHVAQYDREDEPDRETTIQPVVLDTRSGTPATIHEYQLDSGCYLIWTVEQVS